MTDMEKKVMVRLCAKILTETELYDTDRVSSVELFGGVLVILFGCDFGFK